MRKIPTDLRHEMDADPWYHRCCVTGATAGKIEWHHNLIYAGRQVGEKWAILPLAKEVHDIANYPAIRDVLDWIMLNRMTDQDLRQFSKAINLTHRKTFLNKRFKKKWKPGTYLRDTINSL